MTNIIVAGLIVSQIIILPFISFRWIKEYSVQLMIITSICGAIWQKNKWLASYIAWSFLMFIAFRCYEVNDYKNVMSYQINILALLNIINIVLYGVLYLILHKIKLEVPKLEKTLCLIAVFQSIYVILQKFQFDQFFSNFTINGIRWPVGTWGNEALVAWFIAICSPYFLRYKGMRFKVGYIICFLAVLCTKVSAGILAFAIGYIFWLWFKNRKYAVMLITGIVLIGVVLLYTGQLKYYLDDTHRFKVWSQALAICKKAPITGQGLGSFRQMFPQMATAELTHDGVWAQAHNEFIQIYFEQGIIALGLVLGLIWGVFLSFFKTRKGVIPLASLLGLFVISFFGFPLHTAMGVLLIISLVLYEREQEWLVEAT